MKKIICVLICATLCLAVFAGCGDNSDKTVPAEPSSQNETTTKNSSIDPETGTGEDMTTEPTQETTTEEDGEPTTGSEIPDWPVAEEDVKNYVNMVYGKYEIYRFKEMNISSPSQYGSVFPRKDAFGSYKAPSFIESKLYKSAEELLVENGEEVSGGGILTPAEAQYISATAQSTVFGAVRISKVQQAVNEIFGSGRFTFDGSIESGYTKSGYYIIPASAGNDGAASLDHYTVESVTFDDETSTATATVTEKWTDYSNDGRTVIRKTELSLRISGTSISLKEIFY